MDSKPWYTSRSIWAQFIALAATLGTIAGVDHGLDAESQAALVGGIQAAVAVVMRLITKKPVTL